MYSSGSEIYKLINPEKVANLLGIENDEETLISRIEEFIESADRTIDTKLGSQYVIPITGEQSLRIVKGFSIKLAIGEMYALNSDGKMPEVIYDQVTWARKELDALGGNDIGKPTKILPDATRRITHLVAKHED